MTLGARPMNEDQDNVIHVVFGADGHHRVTMPPPDAPAPVSEPPPAAPKDRDDPLADLYSREEVAKLFGVAVSKLRYWDRSRFIRPSVRRGRRRYYTFQDLIGIRAAKGLLDSGVPLREVRRSVDAIRQALPKVVRPLSELRVVAEGHAMLVRDPSGAFEAKTGQLVLDFKVETLREDVVRVLKREPSDQERQYAYERYLEGCRLDEDPTTFARAETAYREALHLDPSLANAITNLGNLEFRKGDLAGAERLYRQALLVDSEQPEALYNLGFLRLDAGEPAEALLLFERALKADPSFADAHFNAALALESLNQPRRARSHWSAYLELEPAGEWADIARRHLAL